MTTATDIIRDELCQAHGAPLDIDGTCDYCQAEADEARILATPPPIGTAVLHCEEHGTALDENGYCDDCTERASAALVADVDARLDAMREYHHELDDIAASHGAYVGTR